VKNILKQYRIGSFIEVEIREIITTKRVRKHLDRPEEDRVSSKFILEFKVNDKAKEEKVAQLGWRAYTCNTPINELSTRDAILCYRNEYKIEHKFNELLNKITALMPVFLQKEPIIKALIRFLLLALKYVSVIEYQVRNKLKATKQIVKELYAGNPGRATNKPTTNMLLRAFKNITLVIVPIENKKFVKISDFKPIQLKILELLNISPEIYSRFNQLSFSNIDFSEM
jgi:transposase